MAKNWILCYLKKNNIYYIIEDVKGGQKKLKENT